MKKFIASAAVVFAAINCSPALADEDSPHQISGNLTLTTDYLYRGISQTNENFAVQAGLDYSHVPTGLYAGTWASNVDFAESSEFDFYGGWAGETINGIAWDVGGLYYMYPGSDAEPEENFFEVYGNLGYSFSEVQFEPSVGVGVAYSPDFFGEDGDGVYLHSNLDLSLPYDFGLSFLVGYQDVEGDQLWSRWIQLCALVSGCPRASVRWG